MTCVSLTGKQKMGGGGGVRCCVTRWEGAEEGGVLASVTPSYEMRGKPNV